LYESRLSDHIELHLDSQGNLIGISIESLSPFCIGSHPSNKDLKVFNTTVDLVQTTTGPA
jgi:hypothetical protein